MLQINHEMSMAISTRHKVTKYMDTPLSSNVIKALNMRISDINDITGELKLKLMLNDTKELTAFFKLFLSKNVKNYIILSGKDSVDLEEKLGYYEMDIMLYAQSLGLNTWWIGDIYNKKSTQKEMYNYRVIGIIAFGYGAHNGTPHKSKNASEVSVYNGNVPKWFKSGVNACLLAPTALNKQSFFINGTGNKVTLSCNNGNYSHVEKGILKYSFELAAGRDAFEWA